MIIFSITFSYFLSLIHPSSSHFTILSLPFTVFVNFNIVCFSISHILHVSTSVCFYLTNHIIVFNFNKPDISILYWQFILFFLSQKLFISFSFTPQSHFPITVPLTLSPYFRVLILISTFPSPQFYLFILVSSFLSHHFHPFIFPFPPQYLIFISLFSILLITVHSFVLRFLSHSCFPIFSSSLSSLFSYPNSHFFFFTFFFYFSLFTNHFLVSSL